MERRFVLLSDTIPERPAELRPIPCPHCQGQQQGKRSSSLKNIRRFMFKARRPNLTIRPAIARLSEFIYRFWQVRIPRANPLSKSLCSH
jgi:hypothetical protein